jgi:O-antigen/teichoic acid export membrane protein
MTPATLTADKHREAATELRADTLAASVMILVVMSVVQRLVGFTRGVLFCRWLSPEELGRWDMAVGFLYFAAPLIVLGLPGSFGRYTEHFRQRGMLKTFLRRAAVVTIGLIAIGATATWLAAPQLARFIFGSQADAHLVVILAVCLAVVTASNFIAELFTSLRLYRFNSALQFLLSLSFAVISLGLLVFRGPNVSSIVIGFLAANGVVVLVSLPLLRRTWRQLPGDVNSLSKRALWKRVLPFATGVWVVNWLANAFEIVDRYMIVHCSGLDAESALVLVGNYHSARVVPLLLVSLSALLGTIILPHLSKDWETGHRDLVGDRLNLTVKLLGFVLSVGATVVLMAAPLLFGVAFNGKYDGGLSVLPLTLTYCVWLGTAYVADRYLWCAERTRLASISFLIGLIANVGLNLLLLPRYGLYGAVLATTIANFIALVLILGFSRWLGMSIHRGTWLVVGLPLAFCLGPWVSFGVLSLVATIAFSTNLLLHADEKQELLGVWRRATERLSALRTKT